MDTLVLVDHKSLKIKWYLRKNFKRQHSPSITKDGMILIFDNKGGSKNFGKTRIVSYNLNNKKFHSIFEGNNKFFFESLIRGRIQIFKNEIYITSSQQGEVFKLNCLNENLNECEPNLLFASLNKDKPESIFVADFYSEDFFSKDFLIKLNQIQ